MTGSLDEHDRQPLKGTMKKLALILLVTAAACAANPPTEMTSQAAIDQMYWMLGSDPSTPNVWHCSGSYHDAAPMFTARTVDVAYTFWLDSVDSTIVHATYVEAAAHDNPTPLSTVETWRLTSAPFAGALSLELSIAGSDGSAQHATGFNLAGGLDTNGNTGFDTRSSVTRAWQLSVRTHPDGTWNGFYSIKTGAPGLTRYLDTTCRRDVETQGALVAAPQACQLDPRTGRCKVSEDTLLTRARDAVATRLSAPREEIVCGPGADEGVYQCDRRTAGGVVDCVVVFTDGGLIEELHCDYLPN